MSVKSYIAVVMMLASTAACAPSAEAEESDETEEATTSTVAMPVALENDQVPGPLDYPVPSIPLQQQHRLWNLPKTSEMLRETGPVGNCAVHFVKFFDPARGRTVQIAVTVCN